MQQGKSSFGNPLWALVVSARMRGSIETGSGVLNLRLEFGFFRIDYSSALSVVLGSCLQSSTL